ncbi:MAG: metal-dependent transcriptional regulator [Saprospiraceae bacterium]|nr:metal-dependent transcriptional regulator [Saprospiraceae bacterium]
MLITPAEENYLKAIFKIAEQEDKPVQTNAIAHEMNTAAASVTDMLKRLAEKQLITYEKYRGVQLSPAGNQIATVLIRKHRLWETFLVDKLGFPWDQVHELAEQLEHIQSDTLTSRLDQFLGFPSFDPHGDPIPDAQGRWNRRAQIALSDMQAGQKGKLTAVADDAALFLQYLDQLGLALHAEITVLERFPFDQSMKVLIGEKATVLSEKVCQNLYCAV